MTFDKPALLRLLRAQFRIDWHGLHGARHWARVRHHGLRIAEDRGADRLVVELFALLHDSQRENEHLDPAHGERAAAFAATLNHGYFDLSPTQLDCLTQAMRFHSEGLMHPDATIQTCWDADRLDLGRVGIIPSPDYLSEFAAPLIDEALAWSEADTGIDL